VASVGAWLESPQVVIDLGSFNTLRVGVGAAPVYERLTHIRQVAHQGWGVAWWSRVPVIPLKKGPAQPGGDNDAQLRAAA
jgi:hypothetical protein